jgi:hypothetical protein
MTPNLADYHHSPLVRRTVAAIVPIACPPEVETLGLVDAVVDHFELSLRSLPALVRTGLIAGITSYQLMSRSWPGHWGRAASGLDRDRATRYYDNWRHSPLRLQREFVKGLKGLLCMGYYSQPAVHELIGYTPDGWVAKVTRRRLEVYRGDIEAQAALLLVPEPLPAPIVEDLPTASHTRSEEAS